MIVTGAGPGIMEAANVGAGRDQSFGVNIRLPFEEGVSELFAASDKFVSMKYFFTRKLMLIKESSGFVSLPGGFGTLDETFELLTLFQTGKATPAPLVLLDVHGAHGENGSYWRGWQRFVDDELMSRGLISPGDPSLYTITDDVDEAAEVVRGFWRNYHSIRWVGPRLVIRLHAEPTDDEVAQLNEEFADLVVEGSIERTPPLSAELSDRDELDRARLVLAFDVRKGGRFRSLIEALNHLPSAPPL
jgi:uncharacterized protein (TIGR00730 family)